MIVTATANPVLSQLLVKFMQDAREFVGSKLFPYFFTPLQSAAYYVFDRENMLNAPTSIARGPGGPYTRTRMRLSDDTYNCREYGHEEPVDDRERKKYSIAFDADAAAVRRLAYILALNYEQRVQAAAATLSGNTPSATWDDYTNSNPMADVDAARESIHNATGLDPNLMVISRPVYFKLKEHPKILDKIKYTQRGIVLPEILAAVFQVDEVAVAGGIQNAAAEGQTVNPANIWGKDVYLAHVNAAQDLQAPTFGRTFAWTEETGPEGVLIESYLDETIRADVHRARQDADEKILGAEAGYRISGAIA